METNVVIHQVDPEISVVTQQDRTEEMTLAHRLNLRRDASGNGDPCAPNCSKTNEPELPIVETAKEKNRNLAKCISSYPVWNAQPKEYRVPFIKSVTRVNALLGLSNSESLRVLPHILRGPGLSWFESLPTLATYEQFCQLFRAEYLSSNYRNQIVRQLESTTSSKFDNIAEYVHQKSVMMDELETYWSDSQKSEGLLRGLDPEWQKILFNAPTDDLATVRKQILELASIAATPALQKDRKMMIEKPRAVNAPMAPNRNGLPWNAQRNTAGWNGPPRRPSWTPNPAARPWNPNGSAETRRCYRCNAEGHIARDCTSAPAGRFPAIEGNPTTGPRRPDQQ